MPFPATISEVAVRIGTQSGNISIAIYDLAGTRLATTGTVACPAAGDTLTWTALASSVALDPGVYLIVITADNATMTYAGNTAMGQGVILSTSHPAPSTITPAYTSASRTPAVMLR